MIPRIDHALGGRTLESHHSGSTKEDVVGQFRPLFDKALGKFVCSHMLVVSICHDVNGVEVSGVWAEPHSPKRSGIGSHRLDRGHLEDG